ncbi:MAG: D-alanyl-D-alanine carboxypeptidase family protein [Lachnospiraceae bacterium]|nr:D-alanyl-D-alanine carboxypeptidase family protein [Lachnospiraceae bacterium]
MWNSIRKYKLWTAVSLCLCLVPLKTGAEEDSLGLYARSAVLMDGDSGRILYGKEADTELPMASTTKIMTCIVALEEKSGDTVCTVSGNAAAQPQVKLGMVKDDTFYLRDLLYSLMLESHNDTAVCIAENVSGSVEAFAEKMNRKAREIGCGHTYYITPNGLDAQDNTAAHHTTARELALVMRYCLTQSPKTEEFLEVTRTNSYTFSNIKGTRSYSCTNHNAFLSIMDGALSGKTGFTGKAGYCYVGALERDGKLLIVSLLACGWPNHKGYKWVDTKKLMNYGIENFEKREIITTDLDTEPIRVINGRQEAVSTEVAVHTDSFQLLMKEDEQIETRIELEPSLEAPVKKGQKVGCVKYLVGGAEYAVNPVIAAENVYVRNFDFYFWKVIGLFLL